MAERALLVIDARVVAGRVNEFTDALDRLWPFLRDLDVISTELPMRLGMPGRSEEEWHVLEILDLRDTSLLQEALADTRVARAWDAMANCCTFAPQGYDLTMHVAEKMKPAKIALVEYGFMDDFRKP